MQLKWGIIIVGIVEASSSIVSRDIQWLDLRGGQAGAVLPGCVCLKLDRLWIHFTGLYI